VWQWSRKGNPGSHDPANLDAHTLARTFAPAAFAKGDVFKAVELAADVSRATLQSPLVLDAVRVWAATLTTALSGATKQAVLSLSAAKTALQGRAVKPPILALLNGNWVRTQPYDGAISVVATTLDVFRFTSSFEGAVREGARTSPTCAALAGSLAGGHYGPASIPTEWSHALEESETLSALARRFST
jgi:ADP-ribosylglycohydrolase